MGRFTFILTLAVAHLLTLATPAAALDLYVATNGNDQWSGTLPATQRRGHRRPLRNPGTCKRHCTRPKEAGTPRTGQRLGKRWNLLPGRTIHPHPRRFRHAAVPRHLRRLPQRITDHQRRHPHHGLEETGARGTSGRPKFPQVKSGDWYFHQLFVDKDRRTRARMPNEGYFLNEGPIEPLTDRRKARSDPSTKKGFRFRPGDIQRWTNLDDANVIQFHSWTASVHWIKELDEKNHIVHFTAPANWPHRLLDQKRTLLPRKLPRSPRRSR